METLILKIGDSYNKYYLDSDGVSGLSLGRAFSNDIIITDPFVGEFQLRVDLSPGSEYDWHIEITDRTNPVFLNGKNIESKSVDLRSGDKLTTGRTSIVFYTENHAVPVTREFSIANWLHNHKFKPYIAILMLLVLFGSTMLASYLETATELDWGSLSSVAWGYLILAFIWASGWSLAGRLLKGDYYFSSHLFFTSICLILLLLLNDFGSYIDYMFSSTMAGEIVDGIVIVLLNGLLIGFNLSLATHSSRTFRKGILVSVCIVATIASMVYMRQEEYSNRPSHSVTIKPSFIPKASSVSIEQFISDYDEMFEKLSTMKKQI
ncbi:MAG: FHA domain-containing protein [Gammaproteobacteria bacterium]|nr:FHA domain-containing protein [Gammaproteobacteria bacterium]